MEDSAPWNALAEAVRLAALQELHTLAEDDDWDPPFSTFGST
jgi:hypothetical protein